MPPVGTLSILKSGQHHKVKIINITVYHIWNTIGKILPEWATTVKSNRMPSPGHGFRGEQLGFVGPRNQMTALRNIPTAVNTAIFDKPRKAFLKEHATAAPETQNRRGKHHGRTMEIQRVASGDFVAGSSGCRSAENWAVLSGPIVISTCANTTSHTMSVLIQSR
mmetsp:Transcript_16775/g.46163  ORF Transcript_16775/g.46163 Transcript_16775/m.46163 type:complete len:165 (-) Transcript_16775:58-552(-)